MSIKNDIAMVREELTSEEKFFEKSVITERFVKKYKGLLIAGVVAIIILVVGNIVYDANKESTVLAANKALSELLLDNSNEKALTSLQISSPNLYDAFLYSTAIAKQDMDVLKQLKSSTSKVISDLANYESSKDAQSLSDYSLSQGAIYKDLAQIQGAILLINDGKIEQAHEKLILIGDASSFKKVAQTLLHYGVK